MSAAATVEMDQCWQAARDDTPGANKVAHFNNAGAALQPQPVIDAQKNHIDLESEIGGYDAARQAAQEIENVYRHVGAVIGAAPQNIALTSSATDAYARALSSIPIQRGDVIISDWSEYASNQIQFLSLARRFGVEIVPAPQRAGGGTDIDGLEDLVVSRKPKLVAAVHVNTSSGFVEDAAAIGEVCRRRDVLYLLDGCQSFGQMPVDVQKIGCDFFSAASRKFLRGPRGAGMLYVSEKVLNDGMEPLFIDLRGAVLESAHHYKPREDAKKFEEWEHSYAAQLGFGAAAHYAREIGLEKIERRLSVLSGDIRAKIAELDGWRVCDENTPLCAIIPVSAPELDGERIQAMLAAEGVNTNYTPAAWAPMDEGVRKAGWAIRISPHYYNSPEDIDRLFDALSAASEKARAD
ncbi:aminotransferase class V-fold PLP-dependent enzyme [Hyphococcus sp.]|uniref:aminotransferase class V-fold PLP-dependent enzyme n=1 Tax=Hyphococcus sp. TaxID=2038636 RepID=UPI003CCB8F87